VINGRPVGADALVRVVTQDVRFRPDLSEVSAAMRAFLTDEPVDLSDEEEEPER
jgi:hypothetical protein